MSAATTGAIRIRAARPADKPAVRRFVSRIWSDDYLLEVFDEWVRDRRGRLWVATIDGRVVGVAKLSLVGDRESWLHALRVDPAYRRRGVAAALLTHRIERAKRYGARVARLDTAEGNVAVRKLMRRFAFRVIGRYTLFVARSRSVDPPRRGRAEETAVLMRLTSDDPLNDQYIRRLVTPRDVTRAIRDGDCYVSERAGAFAIVTQYRDRLRLPYVAGRGAELRALLESLRGEAKRRGMRSVAVGLRRDMWAAARAAGYRRVWDDAMLVFERRL